MVKKGQIVEIEIHRITNDNLGVGFAPDGTLLFVENVSDGDDVIKAEIKSVGEESANATKISRLKGDSSANTRSSNTPYEMDDDDEEDSDDESLFDEDEM